METKQQAIVTSVMVFVFVLLTPLTQVQAQTFPRTLYSAWDGCGVGCGTFLGQHGPDNFTGSDTTSTSVTIEIILQYPIGPDEVPVTGLLCSLDNAVPSTCPPTQSATYTNLAIGTHHFKAIWITALGRDPNPPVFTWKIISTTPPPTLRHQIIDNTWAQLCTNPTIANSPQGKLHCK